MGWRKEVIEALEQMLEESRDRPYTVIVRWDEQGAFNVQVAAKLANINHGGERKQKNQDANLRFDVTQESASVLLNVSPRTVSSVKRVEKEAPELIERIERGEITAHEAEQKAKQKTRQTERETKARAGEAKSKTGQGRSALSGEALAIDLDGFEQQ